MDSTVPLKTLKACCKVAEEVQPLASFLAKHDANCLRRAQVRNLLLVAVLVWGPLFA